MRFLIGWAVLVVTLGVLQGSPDQPATISEETLKQLSQKGGRLLDMEVKKALYGVKQMREVMVKNGEKHQHLMKSLQHSSEKKKGAAQLTKEVRGKLQEAEEQCKFSLQFEWEACRPCLEDACKNFYTNTCRRGFSRFTTKVENFFQRVASRFSPSFSPSALLMPREGLQLPESQTAPIPQGEDVQADSPNMDTLMGEEQADSPALEAQSESPTLEAQTQYETSDVEVVRIEDSFSRLATKVGTLFSRSVTLVSRIHDRLDAALQRAFAPPTPGKEEELRPTAIPDLLSPARDSAFLRGVGLEEVLDSFLDFGRSVVEEFGAVVTQVFDDGNEAEEEEKKRERALFPGFLRSRKLCRDLRRRTSECWQLQNQCEPCQGPLLTECPSVRELHVELEQASELLQVSESQYQQVLDIAQRHTDDTISWLSNMAAEFSWVGALADPTLNITPDNAFIITQVAPGGEGDSRSGETKVELNILNSAPMHLSVPGELEVQDPSFIQHVTLEALNTFKLQQRNQEE